MTREALKIFIDFECVGFDCFGEELPRFGEGG